MLSTPITERWDVLKPAAVHSAAVSDDGAAQSLTWQSASRPGCISETLCSLNSSGALPLWIFLAILLIRKSAYCGKCCRVTGGRFECVLLPLLWKHSRASDSSEPWLHNALFSGMSSACSQ